MRKPPKFDEMPDVLTVPQMARLLQISRSHAYNLIETNQIPHVRLGKAIRIPKHTLKQFLGEEPESINSVMATEFEISPLS